jgi:hypothetical protein
MRAKWIWTVVAAGIYAGILLVYGQAGAGVEGITPLSWLYAGAYGAFGILLLGAVARWWQSGSPALWRPFMLSVGSLAAALEVWSNAQAAPSGALVDRWMLALVGLLVAALLARLLPNRVIRQWLGIDRRLHDAGR